MENASKALIMAAEILIGVMIISIGVYIFNEMGSYSSETTSQIEEAQLQQFNNQFLKYYGQTTNDEGKLEDVKCTIHDIIGLANLANKINVGNGFENQEEISDSSFYIQIDVKIGSKTYQHLEAMPQTELITMLKANDIEVTNVGGINEANTKYFKALEPEIGKNTNRVNHMKFVEI